MKIHFAARLTALLIGAAVANSAAALTTNGVNATMTVDSWGQGYCANISIANASTGAVTSWTLVAALNGTTLNNAWGGTTTVSGGSLTIKPVDYNTNIAAGATATLGFCGTGTGTPSLTTFTVVGGSSTTTNFSLAVTKGGAGSGTVSSTPSGVSCGSTCSASFASGVLVTLTATPASGSTFAGWSGACSGTSACVVTMSAAQSVSASFGTSQVTTYTLAVTKSGTGSGTVAGGSINCGSTCSATVASGTSVTLTATAASGSTFAGWSGACTGTSATCMVTMSAAQSVSAAFDLVSTSTSVSVNAGGSATGSFLADAYFSGGSTYSSTATVDTSLVPAPVPAQAVFQTERYGEFTYTISGLAPSSAQTVTLYFAETYWTVAGQRTFNVAINGATVLTAFDIFAAAGGNNRAIARSLGTTANANGQVVIAFTKGGGPDNPKISGLSVATGSIGNSYTLTVNKTGAGTVTSTPANINCGSSCAAIYTSGTAVTLTASPSTGATFAGWGGACTGTGTCIVTMTAAQTATATFNGGSTTQGPCDIYQAASTPCVAAHSTVRALYAAYTGNLYQVRRSDGQTRDIPVLTAGGFASTSVQDSFCANTTCTISIIYDQSGMGNHLKKAPPGATWLPNGGNESSATKGRTTVGGHTVYGIYVTAYSDNVAYRIVSTNGVAKGNQAESMYMVVDGRRYSKDCCFDYGNAETNGKDNGNGTMAALYFGTDTSWGGRGDGNGPWIAADLENGMFKGNAGCYNCNPGPWPSAKSLAYSFVTAILKDPAANTFTLKGGNAQSGGLTTMWNSSRPSPNYYPKKLEGAIILGTGGDGSNGGTGTFFEGAMTIGTPPDSVDDAIQANVVQAGYGR